jgi:hemolysin activation/secretion protein
VNAVISRPLGLPGALSVGGAVSGPGFDATQSGNMRYSMGIGSHGLVASTGVLVALAHPGASLIPLNVRNRLVSVSARLRYPLIRSRARSLYLEGGLALSRSMTDILGQRISEDRQTVGDIGLTFQEAHLLNGSITATVNVFRGLRILGASDRSALRPSVAGFNPNFTRLTFSLQRQQHLAPRVGAVVAMQGQYSGSKLLSGETIAFGGPAIGRGYDPSTIIGDRGIGGVVELRYDLPVAKAWLSGAQFYGFADAAKATSLAGPTTPASRERSRSVGGGVRLFHPRFTASVEVAKALVQVSGSDQRANPRVLMSLSSNF